MKIIIEKQKEKFKEGEPCLMQHKRFSDFIIFASGKLTEDGKGFEGVVISHAQRAKIGSFSECWAKPLFKYFEGKITLKND